MHSNASSRLDNPHAPLNQLVPGIVRIIERLYDARQDIPTGASDILFYVELWHRQEGKPHECLESIRIECEESYPRLPFDECINRLVSLGLMRCWVHEGHQVYSVIPYQKGGA